MDNRRTCGILALIVLVLLGGACLCAFVITGIVGTGFATVGQTGVTETMATELPVETPATLTVNNQVGDITVQSGDTDVIQVQATKEASAFLGTWADDLLQDIEVRTESAGSSARIVVDAPTELRLGSTSVALTVTVPEQTSLDIVNNVGDVRISGTEGDLRLRSNVGEITLRDVTIHEDYDVGADVGDIRFSGRLPEQQGQVLLQTNVGEVIVAVPEDSSFALDAETDVGDITTSFEVQDRQPTDGNPPGEVLMGFVNTEANGVQLILRTDTGDIEIQATP